MSKAKKIKSAATPAPEQAQSVDAASDVAPTEPAATIAPTEPAKKPKASRMPKDQRNGVTRPAADGKCGQVWVVLDALKAEGKTPAFETLRIALDTNIADATIRTQWARWRKYTS